jgi:hypothetical protein
MTGEQSRKLKIGDRVSWGAATTDLGTVIGRAFRLRGPRGAQDEFVLAAIAQNLRRLAMLVARPPPAQVPCIA